MIFYILKIFVQKNIYIYIVRFIQISCDWQSRDNKMSFVWSQIWWLCGILYWANMIEESCFVYFVYFSFFTSQGFFNKKINDDILIIIIIIII